MPSIAAANRLGDARSSRPRHPARGGAIGSPIWIVHFVGTGSRPSGPKPRKRRSYRDVRDARAARRSAVIFPMHRVDLLGADDGDRDAAAPGPRAPGGRSRRGRSAPAGSARDTACRRPCSPSGNTATSSPARQQRQRGLHRRAHAADARDDVGHPARAKGEVGDQRAHAPVARVVAVDAVQQHRAVVGDAARVVADQQRRAVVRDVLDAEQAHAEVARPEELQQRRRRARGTRGRGRRRAGPARAGAFGAVAGAHRLDDRARAPSGWSPSDGQSHASLPAIRARP